MVGLMNLLPRRRLRHLAAVLLLFVGATGCTYRPGLNDFAPTRSLGWFSYVSASDIRLRCTAGRDVYRLIYNGNWAEQVRTFDLRPSATGEGAILDEREFEGDAGFQFGTRIASPLGAPLSTFEIPVTTTRLTQAQFRSLAAALTADGLGQPAPAHARLNSWEHYWVAAACIDGRFLYNAWIYPTPRYEALTFPRRLAEIGSGRSFSHARRVEDPSNDPDRMQHSRYSVFTIQLDGAGMPLHLPTL